MSACHSSVGGVGGVRTKMRLCLFGVQLGSSVGVSGGQQLRSARNGLCLQFVDLRGCPLSSAMRDSKSSRRSAVRKNAKKRTMRIVVIRIVHAKIKDGGEGV